MASKLGRRECVDGHKVCRTGFAGRMPSKTENEKQKSQADIRVMFRAVPCSARGPASRKAGALCGGILFVLGLEVVSWQAMIDLRDVRHVIHVI